MPIPEGVTVTADHCTSISGVKSNWSTLYSLVNASGKYLIGTGSSSDGKIAFESDLKDVPIPRFYRVGMVESLPWLYKKIDATTNDVVKDKNGNPVYEGYCMDLLAKIAEKLDFEFEVVIAPDKKYGKKDEASGEWDGLIGDLGLYSVLS